MLQEEVAAAQPDIDKRTEQLVSKGRWAVPGYKASLTPPQDRMVGAIANYFIGEIWRSVRAIDISSISSNMPWPGLYYLRIVNSFKFSVQS
jgi:F-type H+-transporting ATPase subunit d